MHFKNSEYYENLIRQIMVNHVNKNLVDSDKISVNDISITWFSKTLQNWKALAITNLKDKKYYELTFDGDRNRVYLDEYIKVSNNVINLDNIEKDGE